MNARVIARGLVGGVLMFGGLLPAQDQLGMAKAEELVPNEKATRYHSLLLKKPGNSMVFSRFVEAWLDTGSKAGLAAWLERSAKDGGAAEWQVLAALHEYLGEEEAALLAMSEAVKRDELNSSLRLRRAKLQARLLSFEAALQDLEKATADPKIAVEAAKLKGMYLARSGQIEEALKAWQEVIAAHPNDQDLREDLIEVLVAEGIYQEAIETSAKLVVLTKDPYKKALRQLRLGDITILSGDRDAGLKIYEEIMSATGEGTWLEREVLAQIERVFSREDDIQGLRAFYQKLREAHPRRVSVRKVLARQMALNDELEEAVALFREILKITPGDLGNREEFIAFLETNEQWKEARTELTALIELHENDALLWERLARLESKLKNEDALKAALIKVAELRGTEAGGIVSTAALYAQFKLMAEAEEVLRAGREKFPESDEITEALASRLMQNKKDEEALKIWLAMADGADREGILRVSRSLAAAGKRAESLDLLFQRLPDFSDDPLILTQLCSLADEKEGAQKVIPHAIRLVGMSTSPTELEAGIRMALRIVDRAEQQQEVIRDLIAQEDANIALQCFLAAIHTAAGDSNEAVRILESAEASEKEEGGLLARFYRVRFEESEGDYTSAIRVLRGIIATPEGRKTVHYRRLVNLLQESGDLDAALTAVEEWKRIASGDHSAWLRRANLLGVLDRPDDAVVELRRMIGKFGADEGRRATLAVALIEAGEITPAFRIYEQLYEEGEKLADKLKWAGELASLADKEGKMEELLEDFDRRKRTNPRSVAPLLAIAEIHRVLDQYEERRSALLEASRRRPDDTALLASIAEVEERAGEIERAVEILRDAVKRDQTPESKRRLARLLLKNGEIRAGLDVISEIPDMVNDARGVESIVLSLVAASETEHALKFLNDALGGFPADWRLRFVRASILKHEGRSEEAYDEYLSLLATDLEIPGLKPLIPKSAINPMSDYWDNMYGDNGWSRLVPYMMSGRMAISGVTQKGPLQIQLPGSTEEVRILSLINGSSIIFELPIARQKEARRTMTLPGFRDVDIFAMMNTYPQGMMPTLEARFKERPDDSSLAVLYYSMKGNFGGLSEEELKKAEVIIGEKNPPAYVGILLGALMQGGGDQASMITSLIKIFKVVPQNEVNEMMGMYGSLIFTSGQAFGINREGVEPLQEVMSEFALSQNESPESWGWITGVAGYFLREGKADEALTLINRLCLWEKESKAKRGTSPFAGIYSGYGARSQVQLSGPPFPPAELEGIPKEISALFPPPQIEGEDEANSHNQIMAQLLSAGANGLGENHAVILKDQLGGIENSLLRALAQISLESGDTEALVKPMLESNEEDLLRFAAGYYHREKDPRAYEALLKLRMLPLARAERAELDRQIAFVASELVDLKVEGVDLEPARRAALRLRRSISSGDRKTLTEILINLGLEKEAERLTKSQPRAQKSRGNSLWPSANSSFSDRITSLHKKGNIDGAAREAVKQYRRMLSSGSASYQLDDFRQKLERLDLVDDLLAKLDPGESDSKKRRLEFADANRNFLKKSAAKKIYEELLKDYPNLAEAMVGLAVTTPMDELKEEQIIIRKEGEIDEVATSQLMLELWGELRKSSDFEGCLRLADFSSKYLELLKPGDGQPRSLSWAPYYMLEQATDSSFDEDWGPPLFEGLRNSKKGERFEAKAELVSRRNRVLERVFRAMLRHRETAEQGFILLQLSKEQLGLKNEDLISTAKVALKLTLAGRNDPLRRYAGAGGLWSLQTSGYSFGGEGQSVSALSSLDYLASESVASGGKIFTPELLEEMIAVDSQEFQNFAAARDIALASYRDPAAADAAYATWKAEQKTFRSDSVTTFAKQLLLFKTQSGTWTDDLDGLIAKYYRPKAKGWFNASSGSDDFLPDWARWRSASAGEAEFASFLKSFLAERIGPEEDWHLLSEGDRDKRKVNYNKLGSKAVLCHGFLTELLVEDELIRPTLDVLAKHQLELFFPELENQVKKIWSKERSRSNGIFENLKARKLLVSTSDGKAPTPGYLLMLVEGISQIEFSGFRSERSELADLIEQEKGLDPTLAKFAAASLLPQEKAQAVIQPLLEKNPELLSGMAAVSKSRTFKIVRNWFPDLKPETSSTDLKSFFETFTREATAEKLERIDQWIEKGIPGLQDLESDAFWEMVMDAAEVDLDRASKVAERGLTDAFGKSKRRASYDPFDIGKRDADNWVAAFYEYLGKREITGKVHKGLFILSRVYGGDFGQKLLEPAALHGHATDWLWDTLVADIARYDEAKVNDFYPSDRVFQEWLSPLDQPGRSLLAGMLFRNVMKEWREPKPDDFEQIVINHARYAPESEALANLMAVTLAYRNREHQERGAEALDLARQHFRSLLADKHLPALMKVELLHTAAAHYPEMLASAETFEGITTIIQDYGQPRRNLTQTKLRSILPALSEIEFKADPAVFAKLAKAAVDVLYQPRVIARMDTQAVESENTGAGLVSLATRGRQPGIVAGILLKNLELYRGNLEIIWTLAEAGDSELVRKLAAVPGEQYDDSKLSEYLQTSPDLIERLLKMLPERDRYLVEVVLSAKKDSKVSPPTTTFDERMVALAKRYEKHAPRPGVVRLQILSRLSRSKAASEIVAAELRAQALEIAVVATLKDSHHSERTGFLDDIAEVIQRALAADLATGNTELTSQLVDELIESQDTINDWHSDYLASPIFAQVAQALIQEASVNETEAKKTIPKLEKCFLQSLNVRVSSYRSIHTMDGAGLIIHALAGHDHDWKEIREKLKPAEISAYDKALEKQSRSDCFEPLVMGDWAKPACKPVREKVLRALLDNPLYAEREVTYVHQMFGLSDHGFMPYGEVIAAIDALPESHPLKATAMFHRASLKTYREEGRSIESGIAAYDEALALAEKVQDKVTANQIRAHRCDVQFRNERADEAKKNAQLIDQEILPSRDKKWVAREMKKWLK